MLERDAKQQAINQSLKPGFQYFSTLIYLDSHQVLVYLHVIITKKKIKQKGCNFLCMRDTRVRIQAVAFPSFSCIIFV